MQQARERFDPEAEMTAVEFILKQVRNHVGTKVMDYPPLNEAVSGDAINDLFGGQGRQPGLRSGSLTFQWEDVEVTVHTNGQVEIEAV
jgi:hypothetical protein